ncbi:haloacid dehalogenase type II [Amycolatopsis sp. NPDC051372]|uniref:haloacid dehalogenase type II n=1 Tax=unclassified Amycolatopsis TaxID=2618356 RepID=UPI0034202CA7
MLCVFDVNETLLDLRALDELFRELTGSPTARQEWFALVVHTALTVTAAGGYRDFAEIAGLAAVDTADRYGRELTDNDLSRIGDGLRSLPAHADVDEALRTLKRAGHQVVALTNSPLATAEAQLQNAGLAKRFDRIFSAQQVSRLKPAPEPYRQVLNACGTTKAVMIAAHGWDLAGAEAVGMETALIARDNQRPLPGRPATYTATSLPELAAKIS